MRIREKIQAVLWQPHTALACPLSGRNSTYRSDFTSHYYLPRRVPEADLVIMRRLKAAGFCFKTSRAISAFGNAVVFTRFDFAIGSCGLMRQALTQAIHHTTNRRAFQRSLIDLPIMRNVVTDLPLRQRIQCFFVAEGP